MLGDQLGQLLKSFQMDAMYANMFANTGTPICLSQPVHAEGHSVRAHLCNSSEVSWLLFPAKCRIRIRGRERHAGDARGVCVARFL